MTTPRRRPLSFLRFPSRRSSPIDSVLAEVTDHRDSLSPQIVSSESADVLTAQWQTSTPGSNLQAECLPLQSSEDNDDIAVEASVLLVEYNIRRDQLTLEKFRELIEKYDIPTQSFPTGARYDSGRKGGFGRVYQVTSDIDDCKRCHAIKVLRPEKWVADWRIYMRLLREARVWSQLKHDNILHLQCLWFDLPSDISEGHKFPALVAPWCITGNLYRYMDKEKSNGRILSLSERLKIAVDTGKGVQYLHSKVIAHGDIAPTNVLIDGEKAILCDFGISKYEYIVTGLTTRSHGHTMYTSPELLKDANLKATSCSDMYSLGCLSLYVTTGIDPFGTIANSDTVRDKVVAGETPDQHFKSKTQIPPPACLTLLKKMWSFDPSKRPQISDFIDEVGVILSQDSDTVQ